MPRAIWIGTVATLLAAACGSETDDRPVTWAYISAAIIAPNCATASCHSRFTATGGLQLEGASESHVILTGYGGNFVKPGDPGGSQLMKLLRGEDTWRMPPDQPLPDADILLIERWILAGAKND